MARAHGSSPIRKNVESTCKHLFEEHGRDFYGNDIINLGDEAAGPDLLVQCCDIFQRATKHCLEKENETEKSLLFQYGPIAGSYNLRNRIANYFSVKFVTEMRPEDLIITNGATQGLHLVISTLLEFNAVIFVDEFTYMPAIDIMKEFGTFKIVPVKFTKNGVDIDDLKRKIDKHKFEAKSRAFWGMYYTSPTLHNPTGIIFDKGTCLSIVKLARKHEFLVFCDDIYNVLHYRGSRPYSRLFSCDNRADPTYLGNVISNSSFSAIISPGIRLGWLEVPVRLRRVLIKAPVVKSSGCFNHYTGSIVCSLFELELAQKHIHTMYCAFKDRMKAVVETLKKKLPHGCKWVAPQGGCFIWLRIPLVCDAQDFLNICQKKSKIFFMIGTKFAVGSGMGACHVRISISFYQKEILVRAIERFCVLLREYFDRMFRDQAATALPSSKKMLK